MTQKDNSPERRKISNTHIVEIYKNEELIKSLDLETGQRTKICHTQDREESQSDL